MGELRICMIVHGPYPFGQPPRITKEIRAAQATGFCVDVIATRRPGEPARGNASGAQITRLPVVHRRGVGAFALAFEYVTFALLATAVLSARSIRRPYDVVHVNNPPDFLIFCTVIAKLRGSRVVFDVHDLSPDMFAMRFGTGHVASALCAMLRVIERIAGRFADALLTVHQPYRAELVSRRVADAAKIHVIMNGADEDVLDGIRRSVPEPDGVFRIVYHGTVTPHYGLSLLIRALAKLRETTPEARVEIYGEGDAIPGLIEEARILGITESVVITDDFLPHREVLARVAGASVGVIANLPIDLNRFALSTKLLEYIALDIPAVVSDLPTLRAHFSSDEVRFFRPGDADALAASLAAVAAEPAEAERRAEAAHARLADYRWSVSRDRYMALLRQLAGDDGSIGSQLDDVERSRGTASGHLQRGAS